MQGIWRRLHDFSSLQAGRSLCCILMEGKAKAMKLPRLAIGFLLTCKDERLANIQYRKISPKPIPATSAFVFVLCI